MGYLYVKLVVRNLNGEEGIVISPQDFANLNAGIGLDALEKKILNLLKKKDCRN